MSTPITWLLGLAGEGVINKIVGALSANPLAVALEHELARWAQQDAVAATGERYPGTLTAHLFAASLNDAPHRDSLREKLECKEPPDAELWFAALYERWEQVREDAGEDARRFFLLPTNEAAALLRDLAKRLERVCIKTDRQLGIVAIVNRLDEIRPLIDADRSQKYSLDDARMAFLAFSQPLMKWPSTLAKTGDRIPRPESDALLERIVKNASSTTILLGERGAGKSALLADLAVRAVENGWTVFAIKADLLDETTEDEITKTLNLGVPLAQLLTESATLATTLFIIDQLDAVAEIADRSARRLNFLLNLVQRIAGHESLHVLVSSRPFEYRTDARLRTIDAEVINLELPAWNTVAPFLIAADHNAEAFGEPLRELLRNPWALNVYLKIALPDQLFLSLTELLEALWSADVTAAADGAERAALLVEIVSDMTANEQLSVASSIADSRPEAATGLFASGLLVPDGLRLSFRHQTFYEFILARQFARDDAAFVEHVLRGQDGLFVRPSLLATLTYMRETARPRYARVVEALLSRDEVRLHIRSLVVDFISSQREPDPDEIAYVLPRLTNRVFAARILYAAAGSSRWFQVFRDEGAFREILRDFNRASHALALLTEALRTDRHDVLRLVDNEWIDDQRFDRLTAAVIAADGSFEGAALRLALTILERSDHEWLIEQAAGVNTDIAIELLCADLRRRIPGELTERAKSHDAAARSKIYEALGNDTRHELLEELASKRPEHFLNRVWPWFVTVVEARVEKHSNNSMYPSISFIDRDMEPVPGPTIVDALLTAARTLARSDSSSFAEFAFANAGADILILQIIIAAGVEVQAETDPAAAVDHILANQRRLALGFDSRRYSQTARIIAATYAHVDDERRRRLDDAITSFDRYQQRSDDDQQHRQQSAKWSREHRLLLLEAIPNAVCSQEIRCLRTDLRTEFPRAGHSGPRITGGTVGPRLTADELRDMTNDEWLKLFDNVTDANEDTFRLVDVEITRSGGVHVQANAVTEVLKTQTSRGDELLPLLRPDKHQRYAAAVVEAIGPTKNVPDLARLVKDLDARGFTSVEFRARAAAVLDDAAKRHGGLDDETVEFLSRWLTGYPPTPDWTGDGREECDRPQPIVMNRFGSGAIIGVPHRSQIASAISHGLLARPDPSIAHWLEFFRSEIDRDATRTFWWYMLENLPLALNESTADASDVIDALFNAHSHLIRDDRILWLLGRFMPRLQPERLRGWVQPLRDSEDQWERQAFGELVMLAHAWHNDAWTRNEIAHAIRLHDGSVLTGIGFVAPLMWSDPHVRVLYAAVLKTIAADAPATSTEAIAEFLADAVEELLDAETKDVVRAVLASDTALADVVEILINIAEVNAARSPRLAHDIAVRVLDVVGVELSRAGRNIRVAAELTSIAITLHRQVAFRVAGLALFERLIELDVREADAALEILDRRPMHRLPPYQQWRSYRRFRPRHRRL